MSGYDPLPYCRSAFPSHLSLLVQPNAAIALSFCLLRITSLRMLLSFTLSLRQQRRQSLALPSRLQAPKVPLVSSEGDFVQVKSRRNADTRQPQDARLEFVRLLSPCPIDPCS